MIGDGSLEFCDGLGSSPHSLESAREDHVLKCAEGDNANGFPEFAKASFRIVAGEVKERHAGVKSCFARFQANSLLKFASLKHLAACLEVMRKGVPDAVVLEAHRLESLFFDGYDPYFEGDEPPVCRADKTVRLSLVISGTGGTLGSNTPGLGIRSRPENRSPLVP
jgi:hypothetical protein